MSRPWNGKSALQQDLGVARRPIRKFGHAQEAAFLVETGGLEIVGCDPNEVTISRHGLGHGSLDECPTQTMAAVDFVDP